MAARLRVEAVQRPGGPGQVLVRVRRAGICGSDIHYFAHGCCGRFVPTQPFILGHEFVGTVEQVGAEVAQPEIARRGESGRIVRALFAMSLRASQSVRSRAHAR